MPEYIEVNSPFIQNAGGDKYKINLETKASQVKTGDGSNVELRLNMLERAVSGASITHIVNDIAERDALLGVNTGDMVHVLDATGDETVQSGGASYRKLPNGTFHKVHEDEGMDKRLVWSAIEEGPNAGPQAIDLAVAQSHQHLNADVLALLSSINGVLAFRGTTVQKKWIEKAKTIEEVDTQSLANPALVFVEETYDCNCDCEGCENTGDLGAQVYLFADGQFEMLDILGKGNLLPIYASAFTINEAGMLCVDDAESGGLRFKITNNGYLEASNG